MKLRPGLLPVLRAHVGPGVVHPEGGAGEKLRQIPGQNPFGRDIGEVIVHIKTDAVRAQEVFNASPAVFKLCAGIIPGDGFFQALRIRHRNPVGIAAVFTVLTGVGSKKCDHICPFRLRRFCTPQAFDASFSVRRAALPPCQLPLYLPASPDPGESHPGCSHKTGPHRCIAVPPRHGLCRCGW